MITNAWTLMHDHWCMHHWCIHIISLTFISDLDGGTTLWSSVLISPAGIWFKHCSMMFRLCLISSIRHKYLWDVPIDYISVKYNEDWQIPSNDRISLDHNLWQNTLPRPMKNKALNLCHQCTITQKYCMSRVIDVPCSHGWYTNVEHCSTNVEQCSAFIGPCYKSTTAYVLSVIITIVTVRQSTILVNWRNRILKSLFVSRDSRYKTRPAIRRSQDSHTTKTYISTTSWTRNKYQ